MPIAGPQGEGPTTPAEQPLATGDVRSLELGLLLAGAGAVVLFISLFLEWYDPGLDAWTSFEVWDLVLATVAIVALVAVAGRLGFGRPRPNSWLLATSGIAFVVVVAAIVNHPPAAAGVENDPKTGIWLALAGAALMLAGTVLAVARISVAVNVGDAPVTAPVGGRFSRGAGAGTDPEHPPPPPPPPVGGPPPTEPTSRP
jgi:hypothetical protein